MTDSATYREYFAAANTERGFVSFFEEIFFSSNIKKRYIIKGGPGTGKSSLMKRYARRACDEGHTVDVYYCSSDTSSLDGVVVDGEVALLDGTAPHCYDTVLPGAVDSIVNLGEYWNAELLRSRRKEIEALVRKKSEEYRVAYDCLAAYGEVCKLGDEAIKRCIDQKKLSSAVSRLISHKKNNPCGEGCKRVRQVSAFGIHGEVHLDTLCSLAKERVYIEDYYGCASLLLSLACERAVCDGYEVLQSYAVPRSGVLNEIYFPQSGLWIGVGEPTDGERVIKMKRFVRAEALAKIRAELRAVRGASRTLCDIAAEHLAVAGELHEKIEKYYIIAMDFEKMETGCDLLSLKRK